MTTAIRWSYRYGSLEARVSWGDDALTQAIRDGFFAEEHGDEVMDVVEVFDDGRLVETVDDPHHHSVYLECEREELERTRGEPHRPPLGRISLVSPDGQTRPWGSFLARPVLQEAAASLSDLPPDRYVVTEDTSGDET